MSYICMILHIVMSSGLQVSIISSKKYIILLRYVSEAAYFSRAE